MIYGNVLEAVGHTPMIRLNRMAENGSAEILVKYEGLNVGGSIKTRTALNMIEDGERRGLIGPDTVIVEPTSGNQGIGLALIGAVRGYRVKIIMPDSVSVERRKLITHYGAEVILVHDAGNIGDAIEECRLTALKMAEEDPNVFIPGQFENPANPEAHYKTTARELWKDLDGKMDVFVAGVGTGGTVTGVARFWKERNPQVRIIGVEPKSSAVLSGGTSSKHKIQGIGAGFVPQVLQRDLLDEILPVSDEDAFRFARELPRSEGLLAGISSGAALAAAVEVAKRPENEGKNVVVLLPDTGMRYLSGDLFA